MPKQGYEQTEIHKESIRKALKGKSNSGQFQKGQKPWNTDKEWSKEVKEKMRKAKLGKKQTKEQIRKRVEKISGEKNVNWIDGRSRDKHASPAGLKWRMKVFLRDNFTCRFCEKRGVYLEAHHIKSWAKYPELRFEVDNGVTLCLECHKLTDNYKRKNLHRNRNLIN